MHSRTLKNWKAKRSGGQITVYGTDTRTGNESKIVEVDRIEPIDGQVVAIDKANRHHRLLVA